MISKPQPDEYNPYYNTYIKLIGDEPILELLAQQKDTCYDFFKSIPLTKANHTYAEGKWNIKQVLGHMIDVERIFGYRLLCISRGEEQNLPGFNDPQYVLNATFNTRSIENLANEFRAVRDSTLYLARSISKEQESLKGVANGDVISVRALIFILAGHVEHHVQLIKDRYLG